MRFREADRTRSSSSPPRASSTIACGRCGVVCSEREWSALPAVTQVAGTELASLVSRWPDQVVVIVRACRCGAPIARLVLRSAVAAGGELA